MIYIPQALKENIFPKRNLRFSSEKVKRKMTMLSKELRKYKLLSSTINWDYCV